MVKTLHGTLDRNGAGCTVGEFVLASDYAALEARCRELEAALRQAYENTCPSCPDCNGCGNAHDILGKALGSALETACEHEWEPVKVTGDNGVIYNCKKCGGTKGWNPGAAIEHWESVPNRGAK